MKSLPSIRSVVVMPSNFSLPSRLAAIVVLIIAIACAPVASSGVPAPVSSTTSATEVSNQPVPDDAITKQAPSSFLIWPRELSEEWLYNSMSSAGQSPNAGIYYVLPKYTDKETLASISKLAGAMGLGKNLIFGVRVAPTTSDAVQDFTQMYSEVTTTNRYGAEQLSFGNSSVLFTQKQDAISNLYTPLSVRMRRNNVVIYINLTISSLCCPLDKLTPQEVEQLGTTLKNLAKQADNKILYSLKTGKEFAGRPASLQDRVPYITPALATATSTVPVADNDTYNVNGAYMSLRSVNRWSGTGYKELFFNTDKAPWVVNFDYKVTSSISSKVQVFIVDRKYEEQITGPAQRLLMSKSVTAPGTIVNQAGSFKIIMDTSGVDWWIKVGIEQK
ncbi:MAG: hypothetical protein Q7T26_02540 [Dehalococcoidia bacterium]|nr:hypothetical protein [Dehalococcoidia bacterium]